MRTNTIARALGKQFQTTLMLAEAEADADVMSSEGFAACQQECHWWVDFWLSVAYAMEEQKEEAEEAKNRPERLSGLRSRNGVTPHKRNGGKVAKPAEAAV